MKKKIFFLLILFIPFMFSAEELTLDWQGNWGGSSDDYFRKSVVLSDGSIVTYGITYSTDIEELNNDDEDAIVIIKYDKNGKLLWKKFFDGNDSDSFIDIKVLKDDSIILCGSMSSNNIEGLVNHGDSDAIIVKYDKNGNLLWQNSWGGSKSDSYSGIKVLEDDSLILYGRTSSTDIVGLVNHGDSDAIIVKYDKNGNLLWQNSWGGNDYDSFNNIFILNDGTIVSYGNTFSTAIDGLTTKGSSDAIVVKFDKNGNLLWQNVFGGNDYEYFTDLSVLKDGSVIANGYSPSTDLEGVTPNGSYDGIVVKYDKDGELIWQKNWGGSGSERFQKIQVLDDQSFILIFSSGSTDVEGLQHNGGDDIIILKYDKDGNLLWQRNWGGDNYDFAYDFKVLKDYSIIAAGYSRSKDIEGFSYKGNYDAILVKFDSKGNLLWQKSWGGNDSDRYTNIEVLGDTSFMLYGDTTSTDIQGITNSGIKIPIIVRYDNNGNMMWIKSWGNNETGYGTSYIFNNNSLYLYGSAAINEIEGLENNGMNDAVISKYNFHFSLDQKEISNGTSTVEQQGRYGIVKPTPNEGYEVDKVIVKDKSGNVLDVEVTKQEDGTYSFELYTDVSVEVLFKEKLVNPKTGVNSFIGVMFTLMLIGISSFFMIKNCNNGYEL